MRQVIYQGPPVSCLATQPVGRGGLSLAAGAVVDLDEVIGAGGFTVAAALGDLVAHCTPAATAAPAHEGLPADEDEE